MRAPQANAIAERFVRTVRVACPDWLLIVNRRHLERVPQVFVEHDNAHRPHRALRLQAPLPRQPPPTPTVGEIRRRDRAAAWRNARASEAAQAELVSTQSQAVRSAQLFTFQVVSPLTYRRSRT